MSGLPKISIVTPVFNDAAYLEGTINSVLDQKYPALEYIIIDGGSTDGSLEIIKRYEKVIAFWESEPDRGMYDALNKGFARSSGEIMAWSPANDLYATGALNMISDIFSKFPEIDWLTSLFKLTVDEEGKEVGRYKVSGFNKDAFFRGYNVVGRKKYAKYCIQQQSTFWRRSLWEKAGGYIEQRLKAAGDFELWTRFYRYTNLYCVDVPIGVFRSHFGQVSAKDRDEYLLESEHVFDRAGGKYLNAAQEWIWEKLLRRLAVRFPGFVKGFYYSSRVVTQRSRNSEWSIEDRLMI